MVGWTYNQVNLVECQVALVLCLMTGLSSENFSLFLPSHEVHKLLGLKSELYYVRDGEVNLYALGFEVVVPNNISVLRMTWQSLSRQKVHYAIAVLVNKTDALGTPHLDIDKQGLLPVTQEDFKVFLPCTGEKSEEVIIRIQINVTTEGYQNTTFDFKRRKVCLENQNQNGTMLMNLSPMVASTSSFYIAVGCASALIIVITAVATACYVRIQKTCRSNIINYRGDPPRDASTQSQTFLRVDTPNNANTIAGYSGFRRLTSLPTSAPVQVNNLLVSELTEQICEIALEKGKIVLYEKIQEGTFGHTCRGVLTDDGNEVNMKQTAIIKTVSEQASKDQISMLLAEGMKMYGINHKNVLPIIAVCMDNVKQPILVYPFMNKGNLKLFLQKCRFSVQGHCHTLLTQDLVAMAIQIVQGMSHLHKKDIIHGDLATRNCVVDDRLHVKITDNALSRDLFPDDYHCLGDNENRPVKWLALESLLKKEFSTASDVWSFGVTLWELMTLGNQPYKEIDPFEMATSLQDGYRLFQPINCPDELYHLMALCWMTKVEKRPTFSKLLAFFQDFYNALGLYI
ncbi:tyrosine-protein kinase RYK-like isoform X1 [Tachypleus tridentatus]|uniref:tyrosine-protein kinase RYK-like isoform X1 n=1 Tax=Tachypleus tridentatus TaxID=6853 RepID=UPI003FD0D3DB